MRCGIWKKLHREEAARFDQVYSLMAQAPELSFEDAFGVIQSQRTPEEFLARKARGKLKDAIREARSEQKSERIDQAFASWVEEATPLAVVLAQRTLLERLVKVEPVALTFERAGRVEKLQVVLLAAKTDWDACSTRITRDPKLAQKPSPVPREPHRRPIADPRVFLPFVGKSVAIHLRNGIQLKERLAFVGPFDLLLGEEGHLVCVPLHALVHWEPPTV